MAFYWNQFLEVTVYSHSDGSDDFDNNGVDAGPFEGLWNDEINRIVGAKRSTDNLDGPIKVIYDKVDLKIYTNQLRSQLKALQKSKDRKSVECKFCKNNGEDERQYKSHQFQDADGKVQCPVLRKYECPICHQSGDSAHTVKYCPKKRIFSLEDTINMERRRPHFSRQILISV
uniref:Nanos1 n=1 Tax=Clogmia albipunctata TaxID=85120 RepID=A0A5P8HXR0_CLOAL|nr:nanos1 [Clogmia albipunctata]